jgi:hypothetical protein
VREAEDIQGIHTKSTRAISSKTNTFKSRNLVQPLDEE